MRISLAAARVNAELTQSEAAERIGVSRSTIVNWESGKTSPDARVFRKIADVYNISVNYIFLPDTLPK